MIQKRNNRRKRIDTRALVYSLLATFLAMAAILAWKASRKRKTEWAILLGCPGRKDGSMSSSQIKRCRKAIELYRKGRFEKLLICGGITKNERAESEMMESYIRSVVPSMPITCEKTSQTTWQNFEQAREKIGNVPILVITSSTHTFRAGQMARHFFTTVYTEGALELRPRHILREISSLVLYYWLEFSKREAGRKSGQS